MKVLFLIILNSLLLFVGIKYGNDYLFGTQNLASITTACINDVKAFCDIRSYFLLGTLLTIVNLGIIFLFKKLTLPEYIITKFIGIIFGTTATFLLFARITESLKISMLSYNINGITNFIIIVAIFSFLNTLYSIIFIK
ncbi:MAG: hypothetical protein N4A38_04085 [Candidatus Gracilibacteria bacterium]|nr:hypothetical protein [Candidatus Gracilibacteria bacterium]